MTHARSLGHGLALIASLTASCDVAIGLGNTSRTEGRSSGSTTDRAPRACRYEGRAVAAEPDRLSRISGEQIAGWMRDALRQDSAQCASQVVRVRPELDAGDGFPTLERVRAWLRALLERQGRASAVVFDLGLDAETIRPWYLARELAREGYNAHMLFAVGALAPRDLDGRYLSEGGVVHEGFTTDVRRARRWSWHGAPMVIVRVDGREGLSFPCPDDSSARCALRVLDPVLRSDRLRGTTDDAIGLLSLMDWVRALRPAEPAQGLSLELGRRGQILPRTLSGAETLSELVLTDADQCNLDPTTLNERVALLQRASHRPWRASYRRIFAVQSDRNGATVALEGLNQSLHTTDASTVATLERALAAGQSVSADFDPRTREVTQVTVEEHGAPSPCLRAVLAAE
ncbi:MAG: hypothetical protein Q8Q09_03725 [Deltaproteobacteria bacterium]|nr:hypothetical protein [Deltaproteobacteria bacterium]